MHLLLSLLARPVVGLVDRSFRDEYCHLSLPCPAGTASTLNQTDLGRDGFVEYDVIHVRDVQSLFTYTSCHEQVVASLPKIFEDIHLLTLAQTDVICVASCLTDKADGRNTIQLVQSLDQRLDSISVLSEDDDLRILVQLQVPFDKLSKSLLLGMFSLLHRER